jgi:cyanophycin synthetase
MLSMNDVVRTKLTFKIQHRFTGSNPYCKTAALISTLSVDGQLSIEKVEAIKQSLKHQYSDWFELPTLLEQQTQDSTTCLAMLLAVWAKELLNSVRGFIQAAGAVSENESSATLWLEYHDPILAEQALRLAYSVIQAELNDAIATKELKQRIHRLQLLCRRQHPDYQARILMEAATAKAIPFLQIAPGSRFWQFGWGKRSQVFFESSSNYDGTVAGMMSNSKAVTKQILNEMAMPTPAHVLIAQAAELADAAKKIGWPCVVKPLDRGGGKGVTAEIYNMSALQIAFRHARQYTKGKIMVEAFVEGNDYRLMVVNGQLISAVQRVPPTVIGDGEKRVRDLVDELNNDRTNNLVKSNYKRPVTLDSTVETQLALQKLTLDSIPEDRQQVFLRSNANLSTGGSAIDVFDSVHPEVKVFAEIISDSFGLGVSGIDYLTSDIQQSVKDSNGAFIEVNNMPGMEVAIAAGANAIDIGMKVLGNKPARIPVVMLLLTSDLDGIASEQIVEIANEFGWATLFGNQLNIKGLTLATNHLTPPEKVNSVLKNKASEGALIVWAENELYKFGMPVDNVDAVIIVNVSLPEMWSKVVKESASSHVQCIDADNTMQQCRSIISDLSKV